MKNKKTLIIIISITALIIIGICIYYFAIKKDNKIDNPTNGQDNQTEISYPYRDNDGRIRYKLIINNKEIETKNYPFKLTEEEKGAYFPIKDILNYLGIDYLESEDNKVLVSKINNNKIRIDADERNMIYGKTELHAYDASIKVILVDNVLYVPSFYFMSLTNNTIVDFTKDNTSATLTTDLVVDSSTSGTSGVALVENTQGSTSNGYHICSKCGGAGGYNEAYYEQPLVNGRYVQIKKYRWVTCPVCGGTGHVH